MWKVKVLLEGYFQEISPKKCLAGSTVILVKNKKENILVDTGNPQDKDKIIRALKKNGLKKESINKVVLTHFHPDHTGCNFLFPKAHFFVPGVCFYDNVFDRNIKKQILGKNLELLSTPGHSEDSATLLVKNKDKTIACVGDLFWFEGDEKVKLLEEDCFDKKLFYANRKRILELADYIIPGHGKMFEVKNNK